MALNHLLKITAIPQRKDLPGEVVNSLSREVFKARVEHHLAGVL